LAANDGNHPGVHAHQPSDEEGSANSEPETEDQATVELSDSQSLPSTPLSQREASVTAQVAQQGQQPDFAPTVSPLAGNLIPSTPRFGPGPACGRTLAAPTSAHAPFYISSTDTSDFSIKRRPSNTGVRRKSLSGHNVIAEATKASGDVMATQMRDMATASRELERSKIDVQLKLFSEQMEYQREKDRRLYKNSLIANENARLAIIKQGEVVSCLAHLSTVLSMGLKVSSKVGSRTEEESGPVGATFDEAKTSTALPTSYPVTSSLGSVPIPPS
jgi:hypothetical protein